MTVLAYRVKNGEKKVPALTPNYKAASDFTLGKHITPAPFNKNIELQEGIHLHFVLPSALKHGQTNPDSQKFVYPHVPDKYIVTRMYPSIDNEGNKKIIHDCFIVDSSFYSTEKYGNNITIPFEEESKQRSYRYLGRQYIINDNVPEPEQKTDEGNLKELFAIGPGDPLFNAYYPSCRSVFGFYDDLENVPENAVLTYSVIGYYSDENNDDIVKSLQETEERVKKEEQAKIKADDDEKTLEQKILEAKLETLKTNYKLTLKQDPYSNEIDWNSILLFGEVCNIDLSKSNPLPLGEINTGIGRTSAETLSAVIAQKYSDSNPLIERALTTLQYDMENELSQVDGNFKIDDNIHSYGFTSIDPIETQFEITFDKKNDIPKEDLSEFLSTINSDYNDLCNELRNLGKLRRTLEFEKKTLYYLWEIYINNSYSSHDTLNKLINDTIDEIHIIREKGLKNAKKNIETIRNTIQKKLKEKNVSDKIKIEEISAKPFYMPKDPALMLFGSGMKRTYAFGEDGRFENDNTLSCLSSPMIFDGIDEDQKKNATELNAKITHTFTFSNNSIDRIKKSIDYDRYLNFLVMTVLLDENLYGSIETEKEDLKNLIEQRNPSPVIINKNPYEEVILFMEWELLFYNSYKNSIASDSKLEYGDTDFTNDKEKNTENERWCIGSSVLTPHGICNLENKIRKYADYLSTTSDKKNLVELAKKINELAKDIKDIPVLSQNLGGFTINLASLKSVFQMPIEGTDEITQNIIKCLNNSGKDELDIERLAVIENSEVIPLREGYLDLKNLSIVSSFGNTRKIIQENQLLSKNKICISECLCSTATDKNGGKECFLPLALTSPARLSPYFVSAESSSVRSNSLPGTSPIIAIIMPDILNRNLDIFNNKGDLIGVIKTVYRNNRAEGRYAPICKDPKLIDSRLKSFIDSLTDEKSFTDKTSRLSELIDIIKLKLDNTIPINQKDFIFGRALVLAEMDVELEYHGGTEFSKKMESIGNLDDKGLYNQKFQVKIGDINRVTDGVICGFYDDNGEKSFAPFGYNTNKNTFGYKTNKNIYFQDDFPKISGNQTAKVTLLFDSSLKVTLSTGFLPVEQIQVNTAHTDFSKMNLMLAEMNTLISEEDKIQLPDFTNGETFKRLYASKRDENKIIYESLELVKSEQTIATIGKTMINDGFIAKSIESEINK